jgi:transposase-like protein
MVTGEKSGSIVGEEERKIFSGGFKAEVALEAVRGLKTINETAQDFVVHPTQAGQRKQELQEQASGLFKAKRGVRPVGQSANPDRPCSETGRQSRTLGNRLCWH